MINEPLLLMLLFPDRNVMQNYITLHLAVLVYGPYLPFFLLKPVAVRLNHFVWGRQEAQ